MTRELTELIEAHVLAAEEFSHRQSDASQAALTQAAEQLREHLGLPEPSSTGHTKTLAPTPDAFAPYETLFGKPGQLGRAVIADGWELCWISWQTPTGTATLAHGQPECDPPEQVHLVLRDPEGNLMMRAEMTHEQTGPALQALGFVNRES